MIDVEITPNTHVLFHFVDDDITKRSKRFIIIEEDVMFVRT